MSDLVFPAVLFGLIFFALALFGLTESRVEARHPEILERLGGGRFLVPPAKDSFVKSLRWMRFLAFDHFRLKDPWLSTLCVLGIVSQLAAYAMLLGLV